jgi:chloramphenicol 3-O phosphotransferase
MKTPFVHMSFDTYLALFPTRFLEAEGIYLSNIPLSEVENQSSAAGYYAKLVQGFHRSVAAMASTGLDIIVDHAIKNEAWFLECYALLHSYKVYFVGINCALHILEAREIARGDRPIGLSQLHGSTVHENMIYDLEIDSGELSPQACAHMLAAFLSAAPLPHGFEQSYRGCAGAH